MSIEDINQSIAALHTEIDRLEASDPTVKAKLLSLITDVEKQLGNPAPDSQMHDGATLQKLPTLIEQFESDHPQVTDTLGRLLTTLSGMGI